MKTSDLELVARYLAEDRALRPFKKDRQEAVERFVAWLDENSLGLTDLRTPDLDRFMRLIVMEGVQKRVRGAPPAIRELLSRAYAENPATQNPGVGWTAKRVNDEQGEGPGLETIRHYNDHTYSVADLAEILRLGRSMADNAALHKQPILYKRLAVVEMAYSTGMSLAELSALRDHQIPSPHRGFIHIQGKAPRMVPLTQTAYEAVTIWLDHARQFGLPQEGTVFYSTQTLQADNPSALGQLIYKFGKLVAVRDAHKLSQQALRRSCAVHLLDAGARAELVAYVLGLNVVSALKAYTFKGKNTLGAA